jgi:hypothetical protein
MTEENWVKYIVDLLNEKFKEDNHIIIQDKIKLPYAYEILEYEKEMKPSRSLNPLNRRLMEYETDILICEKKGSIVPRIVIEAKRESVTTHDAITYSKKANAHKGITPFLRYGIIIGNRDNSPLPGRLFRHGSDFDFMMNFRRYELSNSEINDLYELILREVKYSKQIQEMIFNSMSTKRKRYGIMEKRLYLKEY